MDRIVKLDRNNIDDIKYLDISNEPFEIIGRLIPRYNDGGWSVSEEIFDAPYEKTYPDDDIDFEEYIKNDGRAFFVYFCDNIYVGHIRIREYWNKNCFVDDIAVRRDFRRMGAGKKLIEQAMVWAKEKDLKGLMLETQDNNLVACRFYQKCGFALGAVDTLLYRNFDNCGEKALFWYLCF